MRPIWISLILSSISQTIGYYDGWIRSPRYHRSYRLFTEFPLPWKEARLYCKRMGASLLSFKDRTEQRFINETLLKNHNNNHVWVGASGRPRASWQWDDGTNLFVKNYDWTADDPFYKEFKDGRVCVATFNLSILERGKLYCIPCVRELNFVCQREDQTTPAKTTLAYSVDTDDETETNTPAAVLAVLLGIFMILSLVFIILYIRQRYKSQHQDGVYEQSQPYTDINEHLYLSCIEEGDQRASVIYDRPGTLRNGCADHSPNISRATGTRADGSAYLDVRTADGFQMFTVS